MKNARSARPCAYPGCPQLVRGRVYCDAHSHYGKRDDTADGRHKLYGRAWQARRVAQLARQPWCEDCLAEGEYTQAVDVHHEERHQGNPVVFARSPLRSCCKACHSRRTAREIKGEGG